MTDDPTVYSPAEVATILGLHPETVRKRLAEGTIPGRKVGGLWIISAERLRRWLESQDEEEVARDGIPIPPEVGRPVDDL